MLRRLHNVPGLFAALFISVLALSGVVLAIYPAVDRAEAVSVSTSQISALDLAVRVVQNHPQVEQIRHTASGKVIVFYFENGRSVSLIVDPENGQSVTDYVPSGIERWVTNLHRSLFLGDGGRIAVGAGALALLLLTISGLQMTARRMGGWHRIFHRARGTGMQRLHVDLGRSVVFGLMFSSVTALYLVLATFEVIPDGMSQGPVFPSEVNGGPTMRVDQIGALHSVGLAELRELTFPYPGDLTDVFSIKTAKGEGFIDQATGQFLVWQDHGLALRIYEFIYMLHTGQGLWWWGLILGATVLFIPVMGLTGFFVWWRRRHSYQRPKQNIAVCAADTIILIGSESGSSWAFAGTLHNALTAAGHKVHCGSLSSFKSDYASAERMFILAATHGDGTVPESAKGFLSRVKLLATPPPFSVTILGFGDRQFPKFCRYAKDVSETLAKMGWKTLLPFATIDRQSAQEFARWGRNLSQVMGENFALVHKPIRPKCTTLTLHSRSDYGAETQAPTAILRFLLPERGPAARLIGRALPRFSAGDLVSILPPNSDVPRDYSLASSRNEGMLEICVRKHPDGLCSTHLHDLQPGDTTQAFIKRNLGFRPAPGRKSVILIGAGTGVGPLAGFIRDNTSLRPMHLYFGVRDRTSDFLYGDDFDKWLADKRLTSLNTASSRAPDHSYVQDRLLQDADHLRVLIAKGAQIMVCGGRDMAAGVLEALNDVLAPIGMEPATLKIQGRYLEDVY